MTPWSPLAGLVYETEEIHGWEVMMALGTCLKTYMLIHAALFEVRHH